MNKEYMAVLNKMEQEQAVYKASLLTHSNEEILHHAYEYVVRQDIIYAFKSMDDMTEEQCRALISLPCPVLSIYRDFLKIETGYMDILRDLIEARSKKGGSHE